MHLPRPLPLAPSSPRAVCGAACPVARRDATDRDRPPAAPTGTIGSPRITSGRNGVRTRPCVAASRCATSKCGSEASRCAHRIEQLYRPRSSSARLSRLNTALPPPEAAERRAERRAAREASHATRSHTADTLAVAPFRGRECLRVPAQGGEGVLYGRPGGGSATADAPGKAWSLRRCSPERQPRSIGTHETRLDGAPRAV